MAGERNGPRMADEGNGARRGWRLAAGGWRQL
jgi:hypothetical protein